MRYSVFGVTTYELGTSAGSFISRSRFSIRRRRPRGSSLAVEMVARDEVPVAAGEFGQQAITVRFFSGKLEQLRPQELGRTEDEDIDGAAQGQWVDRGDGASEDDEGSRGERSRRAAGDAGGVEGVDQVDGVEFEGTTPCQEVEGREGSVILEWFVRRRPGARKIADIGDIRDAGRELHDPLKGER